ncbi:MAG: hypothetical protein B7Z72_01795 [Gemmatimonadetes bacterium 21-71-4]|nr:MAG: hypothetical protein B7Z72_01795 [Gemmatimonadetes bacterium 21-71-4]
MDIIFYAHHAVMSPRLRRRAEQAVARLADRLALPVKAVVRFEEDGPSRRVEIVLHAPRRKPMIAEGRHRYTGSALTEALARLETQIETSRRKQRARARRGSGA